MPYVEMHAVEAVGEFSRGALLVLDVRTIGEWHSGHIPGAIHIPLHELQARYDELDPEERFLVVCAHGIRSAAAGQFLASQGFVEVINLRHGMCAWAGPVVTGP